MPVGGEEVIRTLAPLSRPTPLAGAPLHQLEYFSLYGENKRYSVYRNIIHEYLSFVNSIGKIKLKNNFKIRYNNIYRIYSLFFMFFIFYFLSFTTFLLLFNIQFLYLLYPVFCRSQIFSSSQNIYKE